MSCSTNEGKYKKCPVCGKRFWVSGKWAYKLDTKYFCCYTHYVEGGGDGGLDRYLKISSSVKSERWKKMERYCFVGMTRQKCSGMPSHAKR